MYVASYFILMARNVAAVDQFGNVQFQSAFRFGQTVGRIQKGGPDAVEVSIFNHLYFPLDMVFYRLSPTNSWNQIKLP